MQPATLESLIAPHTKLDFLSEYWESHPLRSDASMLLGRLIDGDGIKSLVSSMTTSDPDWIQLRRAGERILPPREFCDNEGMPQWSKVATLFESGYSLILSKVHQRWPAIEELCRCVEASLTAAGLVLTDRIGSHIYFTPANAQAVLPHYDNLNVFAIQVDGAKTWKIYDPLQRLPLAPLKEPISPDDLPPLRCEVLVETGQVLYIPRGYVHEAAAVGHHSLHVTLDIYTRTWADVVSTIAFDCAEARRSVRVLPNNDVRAEFASTLRRLGSVDAADVLNRLGAETVRNLEPLPGVGFDCVNRLQNIELTTVVRRRAGSFPLLVRQGDRLCLTFPGGGFAAQAEVEPLFRFLAEQPAFAVADLPLLSDEGKMDVVRMLVSDGFLGVDGM